MLLAACILCATYQWGRPCSWSPDFLLPQRFERFAAYYEEMARLASSGLVDVAAHPDFIKACCFDDFQAWLKQPGSLDLYS